MKDVDWDKLIPEMKLWNNGEGIDPEGWINCSGNFQLAAGYTLIFWPKFTELNGMVFEGDVDQAAVDSWMKNCGGEPARVEAMLNHLHIVDLHYLGCPGATVEGIVYLGNVLKEIYSIKLAAEFPNRMFVVEFYEPPDKDLREYQLTFYQPHDS